MACHAKFSMEISHGKFSARKFSAPCHGKFSRNIFSRNIFSGPVSGPVSGPDSGGDRMDAGGDEPSPSSARSSADQGHVLGGADAADAADAVKRHFLDEEIDGLTESEERI